MRVYKQLIKNNFTIERKHNNTISCVDINVNVDESTFLASTYRKLSNTNIIMNYNSRTPESWK